jgi:hypothetical protein
VQPVRELVDRLPQREPIPPCGRNAVLPVGGTWELPVHGGGRVVVLADVHPANAALPAPGKPSVEQRAQRGDHVRAVDVARPLGVCSVGNTDDGDARRLPSYDAGGAVGQAHGLVRMDTEVARDGD